MYKKGSTDRAMVSSIQRALGVPVDGSFGARTEQAVIRFQMSENLVADGIVGRKTLEALGVLDTDIKGTNHYKTEEGLLINKRFLPEGEYIKNAEPILNDYLFIHHTSGWNNPFRCVEAWGRDDRGRIATEFVIGGQNIKNNDDEHDGVVVQAFPDGCQGWHLGATGSKYMARHSVGIELCAFGYLRDGKTYVGTKAHENQIVTLSESFLGYTQWHKYSDAQLNSLKKLIQHISTRDNIDLGEGLVKWILKDGPTKAFGFQEDAHKGKVEGLLTHTNVRKDKTDCFPQQELVDMLLSL